MAPRSIVGRAGFEAAIGTRIGPGEWRRVSQEDIDAFAAVSGDHQWIHVDVERAREQSPYGATIAHGNLSLSLSAQMRMDLIEPEGFAVGVNYGWNKARFPAPVLAGSRIRVWAEVVSVTDRGGGWIEVVIRNTLEVEGGEKPCFVGDSVSRFQEQKTTTRSN